MDFKRGDIYYVDLPPSKGSVQEGVRPCLNIQNEIGNKNSPTIIVCPITKNLHKARLPTHVNIYKNKTNGLGENSCILCESMFTISKKHQVINRMGKLKEEEIKKVNKALRISIGL